MSGPAAPAMRLLIAAASGSPPRAFASVAVAEDDWTALPELAARHGLVAVLARRLPERADAPPSVRSDVDGRARLQAVHALEGIKELLRAVRTLADRGITAVALKGPLFSQWLYGDAGMRQFVDLDLLVRPEDRNAALHALAPLGYRLPYGMPAGTARVVYAGLRAWPLEHERGSVLDLHWGTAHARFGAPLDAATILRESIAIPAGGVEVRVPAATHAALLTLAHAAKHLWRPLESIHAIAQLLRRPDVDWLQVKALACRSGAWTGCATGLELAARLLDGRLPAALYGAPLPPASIALAEAAQRDLLLGGLTEKDRWTERRAQRAALDGARARLRYDLWRLLAPTPLEWEWWPLPPSLAPLYVPLRLLRLASGAGGGLLTEGRSSRAIP